MFEYSARPDLLAGRIILVTGAGRGIGEAARCDHADVGRCVVGACNPVERSLVVRIQRPDSTVGSHTLITGRCQDVARLAGRG